MPGNRPPPCCVPAGTTAAAAIHSRSWWAWSPARASPACGCTRSYPARPCQRPSRTTRSRVARGLAVAAPSAPWWSTCARPAAWKPTTARSGMRRWRPRAHARAWPSACRRAGASSPACCWRPCSGWPLFYRYGTPWAATQLTRFVPLGWEQSISQEERARAGRRLPETQPAARRRARPRCARSARWPRNSVRVRRRRCTATAVRAALRARVPLRHADLARAARRPGRGDRRAGERSHQGGPVGLRPGRRAGARDGPCGAPPRHAAGGRAGRPTPRRTGLALGDVSNLVSMASTVLTAGLAYRRNHEREADCFAAPADAARRAAGRADGRPADLHIDGPPTGGRTLPPHRGRTVPHRRTPWRPHPHGGERQSSHPDAPRPCPGAEGGPRREYDAP